MAVSNIPSNLSNQVAPFLPPGQRPVGQESADSRNSTFKPVEQSAKTAEARVQMQYREQEGEHAQRHAREDDDADPAEREALEDALAADDSPRTRLARQFAGTASRTGRNFDELA